MMLPANAIGYFFDEHAMAPIASYLQAHGVFVLTAFDAGRANREIADADQLAFATTNRLVFVSNDTDFLNPRVVPQLASGQHAGIVYIGQTVSIGQQSRFLRFVAETMTPDAIAGQVLYYFPIEPDLFPDDSAHP
jgi:predicted nuclease of predicted toxin-antitoxin system